MAKVTWSPGIDNVSGALAKAKKKDGHSCGDYVIGTHRVAETTSKDCNRLYIRKAESFKRTTPLQSHELDLRTRFATVARAVAARKKDLSKISTDQIAYREQKDQPGGKKTMKSYLWSLELAAYDQTHNG